MSQRFGNVCYAMLFGKQTLQSLVAVQGVNCSNPEQNQKESEG